MRTLLILLLFAGSVSAQPPQVPRLPVEEPSEVVPDKKPTPKKLPVYSTPQKSVDIVLRDLIRLSAAERPRMMYLSMYNVPLDERAKMVLTVKGHLNGINRTADLRAVGVIDDEVIVIDITGYGWDQALRNKLPDPYFTDKTDKDEIVKWQGGVWPGDGKTYAKSSFTVAIPKGTVVPAPWFTGLQEAAILNQSRVPLVRADWFVAQTGAQEGRGDTGYYDFLGVKDEESFQAVAGFVNRPTLFDYVPKSGITIFGRFVERSEARTGAYWQTFDFATPDVLDLNKRAANREDRDASEQIARNRSGMPMFLLTDKAGKLQASAPANIASNGEASGNDRRVHTYKSCYQCHNNGVLRDVDAKGFSEVIAADRKAVEVIMERGAGMSSKEFASAVVGLIDAYEDGDVDLKTAAIDLGAGENSVARLNVEFADLLRDGKSIPRRVWERVYRDYAIELIR